jgi:hypothetical protein
MAPGYTVVQTAPAWGVYVINDVTTDTSANWGANNTLTVISKTHDTGINGRVDRDLEAIRLAIWRKAERRRRIFECQVIEQRRSSARRPPAPRPRPRPRACSASSRYAVMF